MPLAVVPQRRDLRRAALGRLPAARAEGAPGGNGRRIWRVALERDPAPLALTVGRIAGATIFLLVVAQWDAAALLGSLTGILLARTIALRAQRPNP